MISSDRYEEAWNEAKTFDDFLADAESNRELMEDLHQRARVSDDVLERARSAPMPMKLLVLTEDWCGDSVNTLPPLARLAESLKGVELRILPRDENPDLMNAHLTDGSRSIPVVILLNPDFREVGWWGPRPEELQEWVSSEGRDLPTKERYRRIRKWYARDGGRTTLREVLDLIPASQPA